MKPESKIKVVLVDDHQMIIDSLHLLFNMMEGIEVIATEHDSRKVMDLLKSSQVDVLVTDYRMPHIDGLKLTALVKTEFPDIKVLILSVNEDPKEIQNAFNAGASGYILKKASRKVLEDAVKSVAADKMYFGQHAMKAILTEESNFTSNESYIKLASSLTKRELEIVQLLVDELSSSEIAKRLHISQGTVETHRHNILRKLNVNTTVGVIKFALKAGIGG